MIGRAISLLLLTLMLTLGVGVRAPALADSDEPVSFDRGDVTILTSDGRRLHFAIEIAESADQLRQGLMFREAMADDAGMLFLFGIEEMAAFWMRNTFMALDMLFIARDGRITNIRRNAAPGSTEIVTSTAPVIAVLELKGGMTARLGIAPGDRVLHAAFP